jgi:hypothetical protein
VLASFSKSPVQHLLTRACARARAHTHMHAHTNTHTHTHIHAQTHTQTSPACLFVYLGFLTVLFVYVRGGGFLARVLCFFYACMYMLYVCVRDMLRVYIYNAHTCRHLFTKHNLIEEFQLDQVAFKKKNWLKRIRPEHLI